MAKGEDNIGSHTDEGLSATSFEDIPLCVDATRVIMWLNPVGDS